MSNCYGWSGTDGNGKKVYFLACATSPSWTVNPIYPTGNYSYPSDNGANLTGENAYGAKPGTIAAINSNASLAAWLNGAVASGSCSICLPANDGDCPPGKCKCHSDSYPGYCCSDCNSTAAQIQGLINELKSKNTG